jgi:hypothetical protein
MACTGCAFVLAATVRIGTARAHVRRNIYAYVYVVWISLCVDMISSCLRSVCDPMYKRELRLNIDLPVSAAIRWLVS